MFSQNFNQDLSCFQTVYVEDELKYAQPTIAGLDWLLGIKPENLHHFYRTTQARVHLQDQHRDRGDFLNLDTSEIFIKLGIPISQIEGNSVYVPERLNGIARGLNVRRQFAKEVNG